VGGGVGGGGGEVGGVGGLLVGMVEMTLVLHLRDRARRSPFVGPPRES